MSTIIDHSEKTPEKNTSEDQEKLKVKIAAPYKVYFNEGDVSSISAENDTGPFDILPHHHNFITLLTPCELLIRTRIGDQRIKITRGLMHVKENQVTVFLDI